MYMFAHSSIVYLFFVCVCVLLFFFFFVLCFFFKQKTAYEIQYGLVGSEMCIRDSPYIAQSIQDFWRRWHISLSTWFRDYLYIPLGGNRLGKYRTYINLVIVFFITGLWHGASSVSYTHLTLPTSDLVQISVVAVTLKKKKKYTKKKYNKKQET